jgi:transcriptional regulator with XRE-family HTH domain
MQPELKVKVNGHLAKRLVELREAKHLTQSELANAISDKYNIILNRSALAAYETEVSAPKLETLVAFADYFEVSVDDLLGRAQNRPESLEELAKRQTNMAADLLFYKTLCARWLDAASKFDETHAHLNFEGPGMRDLLRDAHRDVFFKNDMRFQNDIKKRLSPIEFDIFMGVQVDKPLKALAEEKHLSEEETLQIFNEAAKKVADYLQTVLTD